METIKRIESAFELLKADCTYVYTMNDIDTTPLIAKDNFVQEALETCNI